MILFFVQIVQEIDYIMKKTELVHVNQNFMMIENQKTVLNVMKHVRNAKLKQVIALNVQKKKLRIQKFLSNVYVKMAQFQLGMINVIIVTILVELALLQL